MDWPKSYLPGERMELMIAPANRQGQLDRIGLQSIDEICLSYEYVHTEYKHLAPNPKSSYRQLFLRVGGIRAWVLYCDHAAQGMTAEEIAEPIAIYPSRRSANASPIAPRIRPKFEAT